MGNTGTEATDNSEGSSGQEDELKEKVKALIEAFDGEEESFTPEEALTAVCIEALEQGENFTSQNLFELLEVMGLSTYRLEAQAIADDLAADYQSQDGYHPTDRELSENDPHVEDDEFST